MLRKYFQVLCGGVLLLLAPTSNSALAKVSSRVSVVLPRSKNKQMRRLQRRIRARAYRLRTCHKKALKKNLLTKGSVRVSFVVLPTGHVAKVQLGSNLPLRMRSCLTRHIKRWRLGKRRRRLPLGPFTVRFQVKYTGRDTKRARIAAMARIHPPRRSGKTEPVAIAVTCISGNCPRAIHGRSHFDRRPPRPADRASLRPSRGTGKTGSKAGADRSPRTPRSLVSSFVPPPRLRGRLSAKVRAKIRNRVTLLGACHQKALATNPKLRGLAKITMVIRKNGQSSKVSVTISGLNRAVKKCVHAKVSSWRLGRLPRSLFYGPFVVKFSVRPPRRAPRK